LFRMAISYHAALDVLTGLCIDRKLSSFDGGVGPEKSACRK
jgi:hypothetical protein